MIKIFTPVCFPNYASPFQALYKLIADFNQNVLLFIDFPLHSSPRWLFIVLVFVSRLKYVNIARSRTCIPVYRFKKTETRWAGTQYCCCSPCCHVWHLWDRPLWITGRVLISPEPSRPRGSHNRYCGRREPEPRGVLVCFFRLSLSLMSLGCRSEHVLYLLDFSGCVIQLLLCSLTVLVCLSPVLTRAGIVINKSSCPCMDINVRTSHFCVFRENWNARKTVHAKHSNAVKYIVFEVLTTETCLLGCNAV
jgi:hypothetical protein